MNKRKAALAFLLVWLAPLLLAAGLERIDSLMGRDIAEVAPTLRSVYEWNGTTWSPVTLLAWTQNVSVSQNGTSFGAYRQINIIGPTQNVSVGAHGSTVDVTISAANTTVYANTTDSTTITNTTAETTFNTSATFGANVLAAQGRYRITVHGRVLTDASSGTTITFRIKYGTTTLASSGTCLAISGQTGRAFEVVGTVTFRSVGAGGAAHANLRAELYSASDFPIVGMGTSHGGVAVDTTTLKNLGISAQWETADADDQIAIEQIDIVRVN